MILAFGWGDGGGGPDRDHLEFLKRRRDLEGLPRVKIGFAARVLRGSAEARACPKNRYVGELYFQAHRGTYTSQARTKRGNRKSEFALREAELWATAARALKGFDFTPNTPDADLAQAAAQPVPRYPARLVDPPGVRRGRSCLRPGHQPKRSNAGECRGQRIDPTRRGLHGVQLTVLAAHGAGRDCPWARWKSSVPACGWATLPAAKTRRRAPGQR